MDKLSNRCDCGAKVISYRGIHACPYCGAPNCCPQCCKISRLEAERDALREEVNNTIKLGNGVCEQWKLDYENLRSLAKDMGASLEEIIRISENWVNEKLSIKWASQDRLFIQQAKSALARFRGEAI